MIRMMMTAVDVDYVDDDHDHSGRWDTHPKKEKYWPGVVLNTLITLIGQASGHHDHDDWAWHFSDNLLRQQEIIKKWKEVMSRDVLHLA